MMTLRTMLVSALLAVGAMATAFSIQPTNGTTHSAVIEDGAFFSSTRFGATWNSDSDEEDFYVNVVVPVTDSNWPEEVGLNSSLYYYGYTDGDYVSGEYVLGSPVPPSSDWYFDSLIYRDGSVPNGVEPGVYDAFVILLGGSTPASYDLVGVLHYKMDVLQSLGAHVTSSVSNPLIAALQSSDASVTLTNNGTVPIIMSSWYVSGFGLGAPNAPDANQLDFTDFLGNWFGVTVAPGQSHTDLHSRWRAKASNQAGQYVGNIGLIGGKYPGDAIFFASNPQVTLNVGSVRLSGTVHLGNYTASLQGQTLSVKVYQSGNLMETLSCVIGPGGTFELGPATNGPVTLLFETRASLKKGVSVTLDNDPITGMNVILVNGDANNSGEVDPIDIDQVISNFGDQSGSFIDMDGSGEVDPIDIDIVIANFGAQDDIP